MPDTLFWFAVILFAVLLAVAMLGFLANLLEAVYAFLTSTNQDLDNTKRPWK